MDDKITVGIVKSIFFDEYYTLCSTFFSELGVNMLVSPETNEEILNTGIKNSFYEYCFAIKIFLGHIEYLKDKVDYILIPKIESKNTCSCFMQLYDIVQNKYDVNLLNLHVKLDNKVSEESAFIKLGTNLGFGKENSKRAYHIAKNELYKKEKINYLVQQRKLNKNNKKVLFVGYSYYINDYLVGKRLEKIFEGEKIDVLYANIKNPDEKTNNNMYFYENNQLLNNIFNYEKSINGIVLITTYPCESNFELLTYIKNNKKLNNKPIYIYEINKKNENINEFIHNVKGEKYD